MKLAFSKPTDNNAERLQLFTSFRAQGYESLQLKHGQYSEYLDQPERFIEQWGAEASSIASGLIAGGALDEAGIELLRRLFQLAHVVGSERIIFCHAQSRQGLSSSDIAGFAYLLSDLGREAQERYGVTLSLHHHYNQPVMYREDFATFFDAADDRFVKLTVDTAHLVKSGITDIAGIISDYRHVIDNMHIKDITNGSFKVLGQGTIDFAPVFEALHEIGYEGWLCADEESGSDLLTAMETCAQFIKQRL
jgi:sugar phosphate isomerase/epimerase